MNQNDLKSIAKDLFQGYWRRVAGAIDLFPLDKGWDERHIYYAIKKIVECPTKTPEQIIEEIKRSYLEHENNWLVDGGGKG